MKSGASEKFHRLQSCAESCAPCTRSKFVPPVIVVRLSLRFPNLPHEVQAEPFKHAGASAGSELSFYMLPTCFSGLLVKQVEFHVAD